MCISGVVSVEQQLLRRDAMTHICKSVQEGCLPSEEEEIYKLRPAYKTDHLCQS